MNRRLTSALVLLAFAACVDAAQPATAPSVPAAKPAAQATTKPEPDGVRALGGEWIYVEDRTEGRPLAQLGPPMASKFTMRVEEAGDVVILNGHGSGHRDVRIALDGGVTEVVEQTKPVVRYQGAWKDGTFHYDVKFERAPGASGIGMIRRSFTPTEEGLVVRVAVDPPPGGGGSEAVALYRHAEDIPLATPATCTIADVSWLAGAWVGSRPSGSSIEERWSPPLGGSMLAVSRTVSASGKLAAFEYLRIVERNGGLVYAAQPGGAPKTEFLLTEFGPTEGGGKRAVFDNPRHDYPKRIVYELAADGKLSATIGYLKGGTPQRYEFTREGKEAATPP
ncbi:MAG: DUF6265 family protein [Planctomycetota bacterium]|nr:DUF6265 family protein [Planctomycetota bacterium]